MPGDFQLRIPGDLRLPTQWFGLFTTKELARLAVPPTVAFFAVFPPTSWTALGVLGCGVILGVAVARLRVAGLPIDQYLLRVVSWMTTTRHVRTGPVTTRQYRAVETQDGVLIGVVRVQPVNVALRSRGEQQAIHHVWQSLLDSVTYPVSVQSRQRRLDLSAYIEHVRQQRPATPGQAAARVRDAYAAYIEYLNRGELVVTEHYVVVRVEPPTAAPVTTRLDTARAVIARLQGSEQSDPDADSQHVAPQQLVELDQRCTEILQVVDRGHLSADRVTGPALQGLIDQEYVATASCAPDTVTTTATTGTTTHRHVVITDFPSTLPFAWLDTVLGVDGLVDVTQVIRPTETEAVVSELRRRLDHLEAEIGAQQAAGYAGTNEYEARAADADWVLDLLADREATACQYACLITVHHPDSDRCRQVLDHVTTRLTTLQLQYALPRFQTPRLHRSWSLFHATELPTTLFPSPSAAAGFPASTTDAVATQGVVYGERGADGTPVILDRFEWSSHSVVRMGMVGSGKSYAAKLELLRAWLTYPELQIYVVDPKQEYSGLIEALGGEVYTLDSDRADYDFSTDLVAFQVANRGRTENTARLRRVVQHLYTATSQDRRPTLVVVDEARILLNDEAGRDVLNQFVLEARDTNTAITLITQNASHFTHHRQGREILDNVPATVFMRHDRVPQSVVDYFQLSERERHTLYTLKTGTDSVCSEAVLKAPEHGIDTRVTIRATAPEHAIIATADGAPD